MNFWWYDAVEHARELAEAAGRSKKPQVHVKALAHCITELCDALEAIAERVGMPTEEPKDEPTAGMKKAATTGKRRKN